VQVEAINLREFKINIMYHEFPINAQSLKIAQSESRKIAIIFLTYIPAEGILLMLDL